MKISYQAFAKIKDFEGYSRKAYKCPAGVWTIAHGHTKGVKPGDTVTSVEAEHLLKKDLIEFEAFVDKLGVTSQQNRFDALVDFAFNLGCAALENSTLLKKIRACRPDAEIREEFMKWVYARVGGKKKKLPGLVARRKWEADRFLGVV